MKHKKDSKNCSCTILTARILIVIIFAASLVGKIVGFSGQAAWASTSWVPLPGALLIVVAILMELFGVISLVLGWKMREGAYVLALYTLLATVMFHIGPGESLALMKNLGLIGGLLALSMLKPGKYSLDG